MYTHCTNSFLGRTMFGFRGRRYPVRFDHSLFDHHCEAQVVVNATDRYERNFLLGHQTYKEEKNINVVNAPTRRQK